VLTLDIFEKDGGIKGRPVAGLAGKHKILVWNMVSTLQSVPMVSECDARQI
jgi:hypothetical protein